MSDKNRFPYDSYGLSNRQRLTERFTSYVNGASSPQYANHVHVDNFSSTEHFTNNVRPQRSKASRNQSSANIEYFSNRNDYTHRLIEHYDEGDAEESASNANESTTTDQQQSASNSTTITVEHPNIKNIDMTPSTSNNILYQTMWSNLAGEFVKEELSNIKIKKLNTVQNEFNCSGNIRIRANVPDSKEIKPNYMEAFLSAVIPEDNVFYKFKSLIQSEEFMTDLTEKIDGKEQAVKMPESKNIVYTEVPRNKSLRQLLNESLEGDTPKPWHTWYLMYGRNYDSQNKVKNTLTFMINKINELIHYIIDNDITVPNNDVRDRVKAIFAKGDGQVYSYARNTLLLPAILNALAVRNKNDKHCMNGIGWIKAGSQLLPGVGSSTETGGVRMRNVKGTTMTAMQAAPFIIQTNLPMTVEVMEYNTLEGFEAHDEYVERRHTVAEAPDKYKQLITVAPYNYPLTYQNIMNANDSVIHDIPITDEDIKGYQFPESIKVGCFQKYKLEDGTERKGFLADGGVTDPYAYLPVDRNMVIATVEYDIAEIKEGDTNAIERGARALTFNEYQLSTDNNDISQKPTCIRVADGPPGKGKEVAFDISGDYASVKAVYDKGGFTESGRL